MSPALEAHLRLLSTLPVRTHFEKRVEIDNTWRAVGGGMKAKTPEHIRELIKKYSSEGWTYKEIKRALRVSTGTISKIICGLR
jgi:hypothetical protein